MTGARSVMMSGLALGMGVFTCWQPAALQLYFLTSGVLGGATGLLLRQNGFRRMIGIKTLPTPESHELFTKVAKGELKLKDIKDAEGKIRYQAPRVTSSSSPSTRGIKIKAGAAMPAHLKPEAPKVEAGPKDRDHDYEEGAKGSIGERLSYYRRNYRLAYVQRRFAKGAKNMMRRAGYGGAERTPEQERRKRRAEQYEIERRRRFENRN
jgi:YidC/Oxa1 family membrane protein insertase